MLAIPGFLHQPSATANGGAGNGGTAASGDEEPVRGEKKVDPARMANGCIICMCTGEEMEAPVVSECDHCFCKSCILAWVRLSGLRRARCPYCRGSLSAGFAEAVVPASAPADTTPGSKDIKDDEDVDMKVEEEEEEEAKDVTHHGLFDDLSDDMMTAMQWTIEGSAKFNKLCSLITDSGPPGENAFVVVLRTAASVRPMSHALQERLQGAARVFHLDTTHPKTVEQHLHGFNTTAAARAASGATAVLVVNLFSCSMGMDFSAANHLVLVDPHFTPTEFKQVQGRLVRSTQTRVATTHVLKLAGTLDMEQDANTAQHGAIHIMSGARWQLRMIARAMQLAGLE